MTRSKLKACQCGGRPVWTPAESERRRGRRSAVRPERLQCPGCGNRTFSDISRESLAAEWNAAGWCGQGSVAPEFEPFGPEWKTQCSRMRKPELIGLFAGECKARLALEATVREQRARIDMLEYRCAALQVRRNRRELAAVVDRLVQRGIIEKADAAGAKGNLAKGASL